VGKCGLFLYPVQHAERESASAAGLDEADSEAEEAEIEDVSECPNFPQRA
jgi:hypothetical protein